MKSLRLAVFALVCALPMAARAEVTLRLATPGDPLSNPTEDIEITASAIDAAVGTNFFSTQANAVVADLAVLRADLEVAARNQILSDPRTISVLALTVATDPISVRLTQAIGAIGLSVAGIHLNFTEKATVPFPLNILCPTITFTAEVDFTGAGTFNHITGVLDNIDIGDDINVTGASCSGVIGFVINFLDEIFGVVNGLVENKIESNLRVLLDFDTIQTMFSLTNLTQDLVQAIPPGPVKDKVLVLVDQFLFLLSQNRGLQLDISLDPDFYGPTGPLLSLTASHQMPSLAVENTNDTTLITVDSPGAARHDIYWSGGFIASTTNGFLAIPILPETTQILAVGVNSLIPGLKSFPATDLVPANPGCGPEGCFFLE